MPSHQSVQAVSDLIGSIYDCALDPARWEQTLAAIRDALSAQNVVLHLNDTRNHRVLIQKSVGMDSYWLEQAIERADEMHALLPSRPKLDDPYVLSRHVNHAVAEASPFVQGWLKPQGLVDMMQLFLIVAPARFSGLGLSWNAEHGAMTDSEFELAALLLPHVRRAVTISDVLEVRTIERVRMAQIVEALSSGVMLTDERGAILYANTAAEELLRDGEFICQEGRVLRARDPSAAHELREAVLLAARDETGIGSIGLAIRLGSPSGPPVFAHVLPLSGSDLRTRLQPQAVAAVFVSSPPDERAGAEAVAAAFGLTPAETRVMTSLLSGRTLAETAAALSVAVTTARTHLDSIFAKTGVTRQADLQRLGTWLAAPTKRKS
jgi:DNA-binding CsgD family transcriptional regulator/PAS domain-containing protein